MSVQGSVCVNNKNDDGDDDDDKIIVYKGIRCDS